MDKTTRNSNSVYWKEAIASIIFDFEGDDYQRPHEEDCHEIAEEILNRIESNWHKLTRDVFNIYACTGWMVEDVNEAAKVQDLVIPEEAAIQFLIDYEWKIIDAMVPAGFEAISYIMDATLSDDPEVERRCKCGATFYALDQGHEDDRRCMKCIDADNAPEEE